MATSKKQTEREIQEEKSQHLMNLIAKKAAYFRSNPHRFAAEYLGINYLKWFQKILLYLMNVSDLFCFLACRGIGKTYLVALFAVVRCVLYPGTKVVVSSYTFKQSKETISKITDDFMHHSPMLRMEIKRWSTGINDCGVWFYNGSYIICKVAGESARGARCNVLIVDESRMVDKNIIDTILSPMLNAPRSPGYLRKPQYKGLQEVGKKYFMSSCWYTQSELYDMAQDYASRMLSGQNVYVVDLPYQASIESGLLLRQTIENEMMEQNFNDISFMMEYEGKFYGSGEDSLFNFKVVNARRNVKELLHDIDYYLDNNAPLPKKGTGVIRTMSVDVALLASRKHDNDASAIIISDNIPNGMNNYTNNVVYIETKEGLVTEDLGLLIMRYKDFYDVDYVALDANGVGQGILDYIMASRIDSAYGGKSYNAMSCVNNDDLNIRCKELKTSDKCVYAIKASAKSNNDMAIALRGAFQNGNINLPIQENDLDEVLKSQIKGYNKLSDMQQAKLKLPYIQTTFLIDELINLDHEVVNGLIKVKEKSGMRKDRYSSLEYNYYVTQELSIQLKPKQTDVKNLVQSLTIRKAKSYSQF